jgi:drug/metabolite transporter (DMT)-like permease
VPESKASSWVPSYLVLGVIWGSSFLFVERGLEFLTPAGIAFWRTFLGALTLVVVLVLQKHRLPRDPKAWLYIWIGGLLMSAIPATLFGFAQQYVTSSLASIMNASTPIFTVIAILIAFRAEKPGPRVLVGLFIGLIGVGTVLAVWQGFGDNEPLAILALIAAVSCYGIGTPFIRRFVEPLNLPREVAVFGQVTTSAITLLPFYAASGWVIGEPKLDSVLSIVLLGAVGTGIAYVMYYRVIAQAGSPIASTVTYLTPVVGVAIGIALLGEQLTWHEPVGAAIVIFGAYIAQSSKSK